MTNQPSLAERFGPYDDERMIRYTVMKYQRDLLTQKEYEIWLAFLAHGKAVAYENPEVEVRARQYWNNTDDAEVNAALELGYATFVNGVTTRLLRERPKELNLNRCPVCEKIVLTPMAKWCMWCKHDWH